MRHIICFLSLLSNAKVTCYLFSSIFYTSVEVDKNKDGLSKLSALTIDLAECLKLRSHN